MPRTGRVQCSLRGAGCSVLFSALLLSGCGSPTQEPQVTVAVAANFQDTAEKIALAFATETGANIRLISGSSGKLYAQIQHGAPFDVFLSADETRAVALEQSGQAVQGSGFVYALGRLVLWSADDTRVPTNGQQLLVSGEFKRLAIANPALAPFGQAAREVLKSLGAWEALQTKIVMGENVAQAFAMVATGNAELGLIALAAVSSPLNKQKGSRWEVPANLHAPIRQRAVLLQHGANNKNAREFLEFLQSDISLTITRDDGYDTE